MSNIYECHSIYSSETEVPATAYRRTKLKNQQAEPTAMNARSSYKETTQKELWAGQLVGIHRF